MRLHRSLTNKEGGADLLIAFPLSHQFEHVDFAFAQSFAADALSKFCGKMNRHTGLAAVYSTNAIHKRLARCVLEKITFRSRLNGAVNIFVAVERREDNDSRFLIAAANFFKCAHAIQLRHPQIKQCYVRMMLFPKIDGFASIGRFADDGHVCFSSDKRNQTFPDDAVIVRDENSDAGSFCIFSFRWFLYN